MFKKLIIIILYKFISLSLFAASPILKSVTMTLEPMTTNMQRRDANGSVCGLVKVIIPGKNIVFEGNLVGDTEYKTSEYWCYLSPNTRYLKIKYPDMEPLMVDFNEYFTNGIQSKRIYEIVLSIPTIGHKTGIPIELSVSSSRSVPFWGMNDYGKWGHKKNPSWRIGNDTLGQVNVYLNLKEGKYDGHIIASKGKSSLIGNVAVGDILTLIPQNDLFKETKVVINDTVIEKQHLSIKLRKSRSSLRGIILDKTNDKPIDGAITKLYYVDKIHDYLSWGQESYGDTLCTSITKKNGSFGFSNCISDYTYYLEVNAPDGYHSRFVTNGINIRPNESDSLKIYLSPICIAGVIIDGKNPIEGAKIGYDGLYDSITETHGDGNFNINGIKDKIISISAPGYKSLRLDISDYLSHVPRDPKWDKAHNTDAINPLKIILKKGSPSEVEDGVYEYYKDKIKRHK